MRKSKQKKGLKVGFLGKGSRFRGWTPYPREDLGYNSETGLFLRRGPECESSDEGWGVLERRTFLDKSTRGKKGSQVEWRSRREENVAKGSGNSK